MHSLGSQNGNFLVDHNPRNLGFKFELDWSNCFNTWRDNAICLYDPHHSPNFFKPTLGLPKVESYFSDCCGEIFCVYSKYFLRRNQRNVAWKLEN